MISTVNDANISTFLDHDLCALILASSSCIQCISYVSDVRYLVASGALGETRVGVMMLDQPGAGRFRLGHPELANAQNLPYILLYRKGERVDGFSARQGHFLVDHSRQTDLVAMS